MLASPQALAVALAAASCALPSPRLLASAASLDGYIVDRLCVKNCREGAPPGESCVRTAPDQTNVIAGPEEHTGWCLLLGGCVQSGYVLMSPDADPVTKMHKVVANFTGEASQAAVLEYIDKTTGDEEVPFPLVTVEYADDAPVLATNGAFGDGSDMVVQVSDAKIMDPWLATADVFSGMETTQKTCKDMSEADIDGNNMCFRSDVKVSKDDAKGMFKIESAGCPDHPNMKAGSGGVVKNPQPEIGFGGVIDSKPKPVTGCCAANPCANACCAADPCAANACCSTDPCAANACYASGKDPCAAENLFCNGGTGCCASSNACCASASALKPCDAGASTVDLCSATCASDAADMTWCSSASDPCAASAADPCAASAVNPCAASSETCCSSAANPCAASAEASCIASTEDMTCCSSIATDICVASAEKCCASSVMACDSSIAADACVASAEKCCASTACIASSTMEMTCAASTGATCSASVCVASDSCASKACCASSSTACMASNPCASKACCSSLPGCMASNPCASKTCCASSLICVASNPCASNTCCASTTLDPCSSNACCAISTPCWASNECCASKGCCGVSPCCGAGPSSCGKVTHGTHDPMFQHYTVMIPQDPGTPGEATKIKDDVVGIMANGVLLDSHTQTWTYDMCNGHSDSKHQYHYHIPPICYLKSMGVPVPESDKWWINDEGTEVRPYAEMPDQFPATGTSPIVGLARDGFPIYALYDSTGALQRSGDLDECNGKEGANGYAYYITADPPFVPTCLRGDKVGTLSHTTTEIACPRDGIKNVIDLSQVTKAPEDVGAGGGSLSGDVTTPDSTESDGSDAYVKATYFALVAAGAAVFV